MTTTPELSDAKRTLLEKYLKGDIDPMVLAPAAQTSVVQPVSVDAPSEVRVEIVPIQPAGSQPPLFYLHVHFIGGAFYAFALARELGDDQPLYVINPYRFEALPVPPSIEEMAAAYLEGMRAVQ
ncbi:MAG: hypothetical protein M3Z66_02715, partial [Chloroflexota bacterium]|nr:hypothetical protein [Chloroflexota bacterium]